MTQTITLNKFCELTKWDSRYCSSKYRLFYTFGESLVRIALQFFVNGEWLYKPTIAFRGTDNAMEFPMVALKDNMGVVINNEQELQQNAQKWLKKDYSMFNLPITKEIVPNLEKKPYEAFEKDIYRRLIRNRFVVDVNVYEESAVLYAVYPHC